MLYMVTFTINIPPMLVYIPYMDPMGNERDFWIICVGSEIGTPKSISDSLKIVYF